MRDRVREMKAGSSDGEGEVLAKIGAGGTGRAADVERFLALTEVFPPVLAADAEVRAALTSAYVEEAAIALFGKAA